MVEVARPGATIEASEPRGPEGGEGGDREGRRRLPPELLASLPDDVHAICQRLRERGHRGWVVGGCVRDLLRGKPPSDWDVATDALPEQVIASFRKVIPTGLQHGTVTVMLAGIGYELTTLRGEGAYTDGRRPDSVEFVSDIARDLARRDFTWNAMAIDPVEGELVDPFHGERDLAARIVRAVGDPLERFREDGLRVLRAARLAATLECSIDPETERAMSAASSIATLRRVSQERVRDEWLKSMKAARPSLAFALMHKTGLLEIIAPELAETAGCEQGEGHAFDALGHALACVDHAPAKPIVRLAALLHDVAKPRTRVVDASTGHVAFPRHAELGAEIAGGLATKLKLSNDERHTVVELVRHHDLAYDPAWRDADVRRFLKRATSALVPPLFELAAANARARGASADDPRSVAAVAATTELHQRALARLAASDALTTRELAIKGNDLIRELGLTPGRRVGALLDELLEAVLDDPALNARAALLDLAARSLARAGQV